MGIAVRQLRPEDERSHFRSGNIDLDRFFRKYAGQNQFRHHIGTTYVAVDGEQVLGFATIAPSEIDVERMPASRRKRLPKYPMPVLRLARLAADERARGRGVGRVLLKAVFVLAKQMSHDYGCVGVGRRCKTGRYIVLRALRVYGIALGDGASGRPTGTTAYVPRARCATGLNEQRQNVAKGTGPEESPQNLFSGRGKSHIGTEPQRSF